MCHGLTSLYAVALNSSWKWYIFFSIFVLVLASSGTLLKLHCSPCSLNTADDDSTLILNNHKLSCGLRCSRWQYATHIAADIAYTALTSRDVNDRLLCQLIRPSNIFFLCVSSEGKGSCKKMHFRFMTNSLQSLQSCFTVERLLV